MSLGLTVPCFYNLLLLHCAVQYECSMHIFAEIATIWIEQNLPKKKIIKKDTHYWNLAILWFARETHAFVFVGFVDEWGFSNDSKPKSFVIKFLFFSLVVVIVYAMYIAVLCGTLLAFVWIEKLYVERDCAGVFFCCSTLLYKCLQCVVTFFLWLLLQLLACANVCECVCIIVTLYIFERITVDVI